jgi:hypothetical protein
VCREHARAGKIHIHARLQRLLLGWAEHGADVCECRPGHDARGVFQLQDRLCLRDIPGTYEAEECANWLFDVMTVYGIEPAKDTETIVMDVPVANMVMPDSRQAFPISHDV